MKTARSTPSAARRSATRQRATRPQGAALPATGYLRLPEVLRVYPVGKSTWWAMVRDGRAPAPVKLGMRCTAWRVEDVVALIERTASGNQQAQHGRP
jgi:prophage regulatory protein